MNLTEKYSTLSTIPENYIEKLKQYILKIHSEDLFVQRKKCEDNIFDIETFEGTIRLCLENDEIKYKFIPSKEFESLMIDTIRNNKSYLLETLSSNVVRIFDNTYKDIM